MPFAICRIQKIKSWGALKFNFSHTARTRETPNANQDVTNKAIIDNYNYINLETLVRDKIGSQKIRSNAVLAVEILLSASADYFRPHAPNEAGIYDKQRLNKFVNATVKWLQTSWGEKVVQAQLHLDEMTPHIHAYLVPLDERGKLNCKALFGTRSKMYQLQDSFANAVKHLGISRGIKGSTATYEKVRKYYGAVNQDSSVINLESSLPQPQPQEDSESYRNRVIEILTPQVETINHQLNERDRILKRKAELKQTAIRSEQLRQELEAQIQILKAKLGNQPDLSMSLVAYELGINPDKQYDDNAVDLVMKVNECNFNDAVVWLCDRFDQSLILPDIKEYTARQALAIAQNAQPTIFTPPTPSKSNWERMKDYLTQEYLIPQELVQMLNQRELIYADDKENIVFVSRDLSGEVTGAYLHTPGNKNNFDIYPQSKRHKGWFHLSVGGYYQQPSTNAIITSSPIEALSAMIRNTPHTDRTLYLTVDSRYSQLPLQALKEIPRIFTATSKDITTAIQENFPHAKSLKYFSLHRKNYVKDIYDQSLER
ncbi:MAG: MobV family relaxase [Mastigocoleus sp.]